MLPSFRLMIMAFLGGFILASAGLHFASSSRTAPFASAPPTLARNEILPVLAGTIDWRHADTPVPALFEARFSAGLTAITAIPAPRLRLEPEPSP
jgi:hypothetical protein